jgi:hypothetical protein
MCRRQGLLGQHATAEASQHAPAADAWVASGAGGQQAGSRQAAVAGASPEALGVAQQPSRSTQQVQTRVVKESVVIWGLLKWGPNIGPLTP